MSCALWPPSSLLRCGCLEPRSLAKVSCVWGGLELELKSTTTAFPKAFRFNRIVPFFWSVFCELWNSGPSLMVDFSLKFAWSLQGRPWFIPLWAQSRIRLPLLVPTDSPWFWLIEAHQNKLPPGCRMQVHRRALSLHGQEQSGLFVEGPKPSPNPSASVPWHPKAIETFDHQVDLQNVTQVCVSPSMHWPGCRCHGEVTHIVFGAVALVDGLGFRLDGRDGVRPFSAVQWWTHSCWKLPVTKMF